MVSIDTVYQKVLAIANKEQRGYITPQEFNLFADQAQKEIFEQYFYDVNQFKRVPGNSTDYSNILNNLEEKISLFERYSIKVRLSNKWGDVKALPKDLYRLGTVRVRYKSEPRARVAEELQLNELNKYGDSPLTAWTRKRPIYTRYSRADGADNLKIYPYPSSDLTVDQVLIDYIRIPKSPNWSYIIINDKALYNENESIDFDLHPSEESELVNRILAMTGIAIEKPQLTSIAMGLETAKVQQEKV